MKIYIVGSLNMDLVIRAPYMPKGGMTIEGGDFMSNPGGKGANQATACAKLGGDAYMVGCVGSAFGNELVEALRSYGVNTQFINRCDDVSSGIAVIVVVDGDNRIILDRGANGKLDRALIDCALQGAEPGDFLVLQLEIAPEIAAYALDKSKKLGMTTVLNPAPATEIPESCFKGCDFFIPNQTEAEYYTGIFPKDEESALACAQALGKRGVKNVIITMGEHGSAYSDGTIFYTVSAHPANAVDTTAAGDTYVGAFVVRLAEGASIREAMDFAGKAAAITVMRRGAQQSIPLRSEVDVL